jgi:hypothetical protein
MAPVSRASEEIRIKIIKRMGNEPSKLFSIDDLKDLGNPQVVRKALNYLVGRKLIKSLRSYPRFYCIVVKTG